MTYAAGVDNDNQLGRLKVAAISKQWIDSLADSSTHVQGSTTIDTSTGQIECLDYGRSFVQAKASWNSPRFWIESRLMLRNSIQGKSEEYLQCGSCKSENTFVEQGLFTDPNYDFLPVFGRQSTVVFRQQALFHDGYREVRATGDWWGGNDCRVRVEKARVLQTPEEISKAMLDGLPIVGQTELRDEKTGNLAVIEYPIKTLNWSEEKQLYQVDTGPVLLPDLTVSPDQWAESFDIAFVAFNKWDEADFVVRGKTPVKIADKQTVDIHHYERKVHLKSWNRLLAYGEAESK